MADSSVWTSQTWILVKGVEWNTCCNILTGLVVEITKCCGNHKVALCFKHLLQVCPDILAADATLLALWKFFHYWLLATNFVKNAAEMYDKKQVTPICSSVTKWTTHDQAYKNICNGFTQIVSALATCVNERKEPDALGIFVEITSPKFLATILILRDIFARVQPLNLTL